MIDDESQNKKIKEKEGSSDRDPTSIYLSEIGKHPLLTREGETALAYRMDAAKIDLLACSFFLGVACDLIKNWIEAIGRKELNVKTIFPPKEEIEIHSEETSEEIPESVNEDCEESEEVCEINDAFVNESVKKLEEAKDVCLLFDKNEEEKMTACLEIAKKWVLSRVDSIRIEEILSKYEFSAKKVEELIRRQVPKVFKNGVDKELFVEVWGNKEKTEILKIFYEKNDDIKHIFDESNEILREIKINIFQYHKFKDRINFSRKELRKAKDEMTSANLRLVVMIARKIGGRGMPLVDLCQEGNIGLMKAVDKFDASRGYKFATYATWWIRQSVTRAQSDQGRLIRVPVHTGEKVAQIRRMVNAYKSEYGVEPPYEKIASECGIGIEFIRRTMSTIRDPISLDEFVSDDGDMTIGELVEDKFTPRPDEVAMTNEMVKNVLTALETLTPREASIVKMRYGIGMNDPATLDECGRAFNITRERVRQIEVKAMQKLKHPSRSKNLKTFFIV